MISLKIIITVIFHPEKFPNHASFLIPIKFVLLCKIYDQIKDFLIR